MSHPTTSRSLGHGRRARATERTLPVEILVALLGPNEIAAITRKLEPLGCTAVSASSTQEVSHLAGTRDFAAAIVNAGARDAAKTLALLAEEHGLPVVLVGAGSLETGLFGRGLPHGATAFVALPDSTNRLGSLMATFASLQRTKFAPLREAVAGVEKRQVELRAQHERWRLLTLAESDFALFFLDPKGTITDWCSSGQALFGYTPAEAIGKPAAMIFTPEDQRDGVPLLELQTAEAHGQAKDNRFHVRRDGSRFFAIGRLVALRDEHGALRGFAKIVRDGSEVLALNESEARFREIFDNAHEGIWVLDENTRVRLANRRIAEILGCPIEELVGHAECEFVLEQDAAAVTQLFEERRRGISGVAKVRFRHRSGHPVWLQMSTRPLMREGRFAGTLDMFTDVTERHAAEERFRVFFELSASGNAIVDPKTGRFLAVNPRFCEIAGRTEQELLRLTFHEITHPEDRVSDGVRYAELHRGAVHEVSGEKRYVRPDGTIVWVQVNTSVMRGLDGEPELQLSAVQDIRRRKAAEAELLDSRTKLRLALDATDLGTFDRVVETDETNWSQRAREILGVPLDVPASKELLLERIHPDDRSVVLNSLQEAEAATETPWEFDHEFRVMLPNDGLRYVAAHGIAVPHAIGDTRTVRIVGTLRDVTPEKEFEQQLQSQVESRTAALEAKTRQLEGFVYTVAHDLRAPLRAMSGYAELLAEEFGEVLGDGREFLRKIKSSAARMDALIRDLVAFSRVTQMDFALEDVPLEEVVDMALGELDNDLTRRRALVGVERPLPWVRGNRTILEQVLINLISNASKFCPPGRRPEIGVFARGKDGVVRLSVRDNGIGIPPEYHDRIFRVFERLEASRGTGGTGIGLAIVAKGIERIGGRYGVESQPNEGSEFWIELPEVKR